MRNSLAFCCLLIALVFCHACNRVTPPTQNSNAPSNSASNLNAEQGNASVKVWVNTASSVYHCPGTRWYGATKAGEYMTQKEAQDKGNRPAYGNVCKWNKAN